MQTGNQDMKGKVYSKSLKRMKKNEGFEYSLQKLKTIEKEIERSAQKIQQKRKPPKTFMEARKQMIDQRSQKNKISEEVDKIMRDLVNQRKLEINNQKINKKHTYRNYRIETEPIHLNENEKIENGQNNVLKKNKSHRKISLKKNLQKDPDNIFPKIGKSNSQVMFDKPKSIKLKTQQELIKRISQDPKRKIFEYINIDNAIKHYRAGMTSLIKGVYHNPFNPYLNNFS